MATETTELAVTSTTTLLSLVGDKYKAEIAGHVETLKKITEVKDDSDARTANAAVNIRVHRINQNPIFNSFAKDTTYAVSWFNLFDPLKD